MAEVPDESPPLVSASEETGPLLKVGRLLNEAGAKYLVAGAYAMILNSVIRATEDVDILIENSTENFERVIAALSRLADGAASELVPHDFAENVVVKIADEVEVDVSTSAWIAEIDGVSIPFLSREDLIRSKLTYRDQDRADVERLRRFSE